MYVSANASFCPELVDRAQITIQNASSTLSTTVSLTCEQLLAEVLVALELVTCASLRHWAFLQLLRTMLYAQWKKNSVFQAVAAWSSSFYEHEMLPRLQQLHFHAFHLCLAALAMYDSNLGVVLFAESFPLVLSGGN